ncbi:MAG TPA: hypothetical protein ENK89_01390 [Desulfobulbaceae bacterium]|nr:hypothetical protein [Desulfobulbaceae bacterium]HHD62846.1 hypothetical protein [Desulfobulbaceae bacterium]
MAKIGRNQPCPCGSGKKYKHCCLLLARSGQPAPPVQPSGFSLRAEIAKIQAAAKSREKAFFETGVFILFADEKGDGWLLEVVECDAVQVARDGQPVEIDLVENSETIEVNWSHTYALRDRQFFVTAYDDKEVEELKRAPAQQIHAAIKRIRKRYTPEVLGMIHVDTKDGDEKIPGKEDTVDSVTDCV